MSCNCDPNPCTCGNPNITIQESAKCSDVFSQLCQTSEVYYEGGGCGNSCCSLAVDLCGMLSNGRFFSSDSSIKFTPVAQQIITPTGTIPGKCKINFQTNDNFFINGESVFQKNLGNPQNRYLTVEGVGLNVSMQVDGTQHKMVLNVTDAALAKELRVGCTTDGYGALIPLKNPTGSVNLRFDCTQFTLTPLALNVTPGNFDTLDIKLKSTPVFTINGTAPNGTGEYKVCGDAPIVATSSATECSGNPGTKIALNYDTDQFKIDGSNKLALKCDFMPNIAEFGDKTDFCGAMLLIQNYMRGNNIQIGGRVSNRAFNATTASAPEIQGTVADSAGNVLQRFNPKVDFTLALPDTEVINISNINVPVAPAGFQYYAHIDFHTDCITETPSATLPDNAVINVSIIPEIDGDVQFGSGSDYQAMVKEVFAVNAKTPESANVNTSVYVKLSAGTHSMKMALWLEYRTDGALLLSAYPNLLFGELKYRGHLILVPLSTNRLT